MLADDDLQKELHKLEEYIDSRKLTKGDIRELFQLCTLKMRLLFIIDSPPFKALKEAIKP